MIARFAGAIGLALAASACGHPMFMPPAGPGTPVVDAADSWAAATAGCRGARSYTAALRISGRAGDQRIWPPLAVDTAVTADQSIYMGATVAGRSIFVLAGSVDRATLWLRREERVVTAPPAEIIEAMLGVSLPPGRLLAIFTGCLTREATMTAAARYGRTLAIDTPDGRVHLVQRDAGWQTRAGEAEGFTVEFARETSSFPQKIWIWSVPGREPRATLDITVSDAEVNGRVPAGVFAPPPGAAGAQPMTIEELRSAGPWKDRSR